VSDAIILDEIEKIVISALLYLQQMDVKTIPTDDPKTDQWKLLAQFSYPANTRRYLQQNGLNFTDETVNFIAGCMRQSEAYFIAFEAAPLDISPLLLYYGSTNLSAGVSALRTGVVPSITVQHHGMTIDKSMVVQTARIADVEIKPVNTKQGALQHFCNVFSNRCAVVNGGTWTVEEIFGSIPDLRQDFENCYQHAQPYTIPVQIVQRTIQNETFLHERIAQADLSRFSNPLDALNSVNQLTKAYLSPRYNTSAKYISLYYRRGTAQIGDYSIFGKKYLQVAHVKCGNALSPSQNIMMFMGLYALGHLSRYYPERWNPFTRSDETGERLVVEKFLAICHRYLPNLMLNEILSERLQFRLFRICREMPQYIVVINQRSY
jgi:YaaC-like protein